MIQKKLVIIVGPTAAGKSALGVALAKKFNGEIISADSRQLYKGLNIGSGKITKNEMMGVPHHLLDIASPKQKFTVAQYQKLALQKIEQIQNKGKIPFLVGGSPMYMYSVVDGWTIPEVKPNYKLRTKLQKLDIEELYKMLKKLDPRRAQTIERKNPRRLIRALEIIITTKKPVPLLQKNPLPRLRSSFRRDFGGQAYSVLFLGIKKSREELKTLIHNRLLKRLRTNSASPRILQTSMIQEVKKLHHPPTGKGLSWKRLEEFGLEYRFIALYLQKKLTYQEMVHQLEKAIIDFSRRQMTWFKKDNRIHWITNARQAEKLTKEFLS